MAAQPKERPPSPGVGLPKGEVALCAEERPEKRNPKHASGRGVGGREDRSTLVDLLDARCYRGRAEKTGSRGEWRRGDSGVLTLNLARKEGLMGFCTARLSSEKHKHTSSRGKWMHGKTHANTKKKRKTLFPTTAPLNTQMGFVH